MTRWIKKQKKTNQHCSWNTNQNLNEVSSHTGQNAHHQKVYKQKILVRMWIKQIPLILLVGMEIDTVTMEDSMEIP